MEQRKRGTIIRGRQRVKFNIFTTSDYLIKTPVWVDDSLSIEAIETVNKLSNKGISTLPVSSKFIKFNKSIMTQYTDNEICRATVFKSPYDMDVVLLSDESCRKHLEQLLWGDEPICHKCGSQSALHKPHKTRGQFRGYYRCKDCNSPFSVTAGTIFENSKVPLRKWFRVISMICLDSAGVSSYTIHKTLGITQKTAWFMLSRIREAFGNIDKDFMFDNVTQMDETLIGGRNANKNVGKRVAGTQGVSLKTKSAVFGMVSSDGMAYAKVVENRKGTTLKPIIRKHVKPGSIIVSDGHKGYRGLWWDFLHVEVVHKKGQFKNGQFHTNSVENLWSNIKPAMKGTYKRVSVKHLQRYLDEFVYRRNTRTLPVGKRFNLLLLQSNQSLNYKQLTAETLQ
ncbi:IS1595 family transposase [Flavobacterium sp.]|uniref:IS1595 family transposase n=1 Tax=Flavobacterium sp. TaxID=239 RepID=UPI002608DBD0|nr:IS1595 family transposase [Flavobacterium sp.]